MFVSHCALLLMRFAQLTASCVCPRIGVFFISFTYQRITRTPTAARVFLQRAAIEEVEDVTVSSILGAFYRTKQALQKPCLSPCYVEIAFLRPFQYVVVSLVFMVNLRRHAVETLSRFLGPG
jgi:hypothetical protein